MDRKLLTTTHVRTRLGVSDQVLREATRRGQLVAVRLGDRIFIPAQAVDAALSGGAFTPRDGDGTAGGAENRLQQRSTLFELELITCVSGHGVPSVQVTIRFRPFFVGRPSSGTESVPQRSRPAGRSDSERKVRVPGRVVELRGSIPIRKMSAND